MMPSPSYEQAGTMVDTPRLGRDTPSSGLKRILRAAIGQIRLGRILRSTGYPLIVPADYLGWKFEPGMSEY